MNETDRREGQTLAARLARQIAEGKSDPEAALVAVEARAEQVAVRFREAMKPAVPFAERNLATLDLYSQAAVEPLFNAFAADDPIALARAEQRADDVAVQLDRGERVLAARDPDGALDALDAASTALLRVS
jgi:hypothetical protein